MGRKLVLAFALLFAGCTSHVERLSDESLFPACGNPQSLGNEIVLLPHHLLVENYIVEMYESLAEISWEHVVIVSPDHFGSGTTAISPADEGEHGFTIHRDYVKQFFPSASVEGYMLKTTATSEEVDRFLTTLLESEQENTLTIFTIDFSHYLPGEIAYVHDLRSIDVLTARDLSAVRTLEVDSPPTAELLVKMLLAKSAVLTNILNTNPSKDIGVETFENTTHIFACSSSLGSEPPPVRKLSVDMFFAHPREWYLGRTMEDRYLYGYDEVHFDQGGTDRAVIEVLSEGTMTEIDLNYFE